MSNRRLPLAFRLYFFIHLLYTIIQAQMQLEEINRRRRLEFISTSEQFDEALGAVLLAQTLPDRRISGQLSLIMERWKYY